MSSGIFPNAPDGGLRPNPAQPNNPAQAYEPVRQPADTDALYYGNGCNVRLRPHVVNSLISEVAATADRAEVHYRSGSLQNLETSVRYLIQRGIPRGGTLIGMPTPWWFDVALDPPATRYNDYMTLTLVPDRDNETFVRINVNALGYVPLLRRDGRELIANDLIAHKPFVCAYYAGAFYMLSWLPDLDVCTGCPGEIVLWPSEIVPHGAYECNGQFVAIEGDERLFSIIRHRYGAIGNTHFRLPDCRGLFVRGWSHGSGRDPDAHARTNRGDGTAGDNIGTHQGDENKRHSHSLTGGGEGGGGGGGGVIDFWDQEITARWQWGQNSYNHGRVYGLLVTTGSTGGTTLIGGFLDTGQGTVAPYWWGWATELAGLQLGGPAGPSGPTGMTQAGGNEARPVNIALMYIIWR